MTIPHRVFHFLLAALAAAALTACGGGDGTVHQTSTGFTVDAGLAQKGPLVRGSSVRINELNPLTSMPAGTTYDVSTNDNLGGFSLKGINFSRQHLEITAQGYYFNELTGAPADDFITLQAQADLSLDRLVNVNTLTDLANARTKALVTRTASPLQFAAARAQAQQEVLAAFYIYNSADLMPGGVDGTGALVPANFSELDISKTAAANQVLAAVSALAVSAGVNGVGISTFMANFEADLADDGLINNSPGFAEPVRAQIDKAAAAVNFGTVAGNLNSFYKSTAYVGSNMQQWVDSSGGEDKVINRNKFSATGVIGTTSKSPAYTPGSDDIGQCMSVSAGTLLVSGVAATAKTVKVVAGKTYSIGLLPTVAGSLTGYIQRSKPAATGACPTTAVPTTGLTRLVKHSVEAPALAPDWTLAWSDEFNGTALDSTVWTHDIGAGGWGNNEAQFYQPQNASVKDGFLTITARRGSVGGAAYTSSRIHTARKKTFAHGRFEMRARLPEGQGMWPAFWLLGANCNAFGLYGGTVSWPGCGEIDVMEMVGGLPDGSGDFTTHGTLHYLNAAGLNPMPSHAFRNPTRLSADFHVYRVDWTPQGFTWSIDGVVFGSQPMAADMTAFQQPFFILLNLAVGGNWGGWPDASTAFPQTYVIDYVRQYTKPW